MKALDDLITEQSRINNERWRLFRENLYLRSALRLMSDEMEWLKAAPADRLALRHEDVQKALAKYRDRYSWALNDEDMPETLL